MVRPFCLIFAAVVGIVSIDRAFAARPMIELTVGETTYAGRAVAHDKHACWLVEPSGRMHQLDLSDVTNFRKSKTKFASMKGVDLRNSLQKEMGHGVDVVGTEHYVVCAAKGRARAYADVFEQTYRSCRLYFQVRGLHIEQPEFPLVSIVLPSQKEFADYMQSEGSRYSPGLMGYYSPTTNRCVLYDHDATTAFDNSVRQFNLRTLAESSPRLFNIPGSTDIVLRGGVEGSVHDTIIHEGMHQVAFNIGVHSRWGQNPRWVVEGLATVFEAPGVRERSSSVHAKLNHERFVWFGDYMANRREKKSLSTFIGSDRMFETATLDAYAQSWALTFYLLETRSSSFAKYLMRLADRDPLETVHAKDRIADFQAEFGKDIDWLEVEMERYFAKLN